MELKEFVRSTLLEIIDGVSEAQQALVEGGSTAVINSGVDRSDHRYAHKRGGRRIETVEFDVALTVTETSDKGIGGRLSIATASIGTERATSVENSEVSRIRFQVPIALPASKAIQEDNEPAIA